MLGLATALGTGLLIGIEPERCKGTGPHRALAGVGTFALASVAGAGAQSTGHPLLVVTGAGRDYRHRDCSAGCLYCKPLAQRSFRREIGKPIACPGMPIFTAQARKVVGNRIDAAMIEPRQQTDMRL